MPLDFTASGLTHSKPNTTLDFVSPEQMLFAFEIGSGGQFTIAGPLSGLFLEGSWYDKSSYKPSGNIVATWSSDLYLGVGYSNYGENFGSVTLVQDKLLYPSGFWEESFGQVQTSPSSAYIHSTGTLDVLWEDVAYSAPIAGVIGNWSNSVYLNPIQIDPPDPQFGSVVIYQDQFIYPDGFLSDQFGSSYVLRWFEYAPPYATLDGSWTSENEYIAPISTLNVNWLPDVGAQTIAPIAFDQSVVSNPKINQTIKVDGSDYLEFGNATFDLPGCYNLYFTGQGNQVPLAFQNLKTDPQGNQVPITFACEAPSGDYTYFTGFIDFVEGASASVDIITSFVFNFYDGSYVEITDLEIPDIGLLPSIYDGAEAEFNLSTESVFGVDFYSGAELTSVLTTTPGAELLTNFYDGGYSTSSLWTLSSFTGNIYSGAAFQFDLTINPAVEMLLDMREGGTGVLASLSTAIQLGTLPAYDGGYTNVTLDTLENWYFYEGASVEAVLSTDVTLVPLAYAGATLDFDVTIFPSEGMGIFAGYDGARVDWSLTTLPKVLLYPNEIKDPQSFNWDILGFGGIDLNNGTCCPVKDDHTRIELTAGPAPDEYYHGDKVVFQVELSALPRFSMQVYEGAYFEGIDPEYLAFNFYDGEAAHISAIQYDEYNFNLCKGNFIPDGDHVNVELVSTELNDCESTVMFDGANVRFELEANPNFQVPLPTGEHMDFDFIIEPAWILNVYDGPYVRVSNPEFAPNFYEGAYTSLIFEEKDWYAYSGETMVLANLSTDYDVEFLERGCLDNEFVPTNENGDPDLDKFNPVPVELEFFSHSILAHCF